MIIDGRGRWWRWCGGNGVSHWQGGIGTTLRSDSFFQCSILTVRGTLMFLGTNTNFEPIFCCNVFIFCISVDILYIHVREKYLAD